MGSKKNENLSYNERMSGDKKQKKTSKLQVMDIVTIAFSVIIVGIMIYVVCTQFDFGKDDSSNPSNPTLSPSTTPGATANTTMTDLGTWYGNILNGSHVSKHDDRLYYISKDENSDTGIFVKYGDVVKQLVKDEASNLNVVHDKKTYADQKGVNAYYVFYTDANGRICYVYDGPIGEGQSGTQVMQTPVVVLEATHSNLMVSGQYLYYLNEDSVICRYDFLGKTEKVLSKYTYSQFVVYFGSIYGVRKADNFVYKVSTSGRSDTAASATPSSTPSVSYEGEDDAYEFRLVKESFKAFTIENNWIYGLIGDKLVRFDADTGDKDTLGTVKADMINVYGEKIVYTSEGKLYYATAEELIVGKTNELSNINISAINLLDTTTIYVVKADDGKLYSSTFTEQSGYSDFAEVK